MTEYLYDRLPSELKKAIDDYNKLIRNEPILKNEIASMYDRNILTIKYEKPLDTIKRLLSISRRYTINDFNRLEEFTSSLTSFLETFELFPELQAEYDKYALYPTDWYGFHRKRMKQLEQKKIEEYKRLEKAKKFDDLIKETHLYSLVIELTKKVEEMQNNLLTTE